MKSGAPPRQPQYLAEDDQARRLLALAVSRQASRFVVSATTARVSLSRRQLEEGIKSRIVGKEGRNARFFEEKAGVDLLLNEEPDAVVVATFDPFRREVARLALESLVRDGRIHPVRIEECLSAARDEADRRAREEARRAVVELGLDPGSFHPAVLRVLGTLAYRHSFGQNQLEHAVESAQLAALLALELGFDASLAARATLLHDLGKALPADFEHEKQDSGHALAGAEFAKRYGEAEAVVQAIASHHEELAPTGWLDHLVIAADALSGARPGARNGSTRNALERSEALERIAREVPGVIESYAVQAGREVRVFVDHGLVDDSRASAIAAEIATRVGEELRFPGPIQVTVLREMRATAVATQSGGFSIKNVKEKPGKGSGG
jgi:ribonuclease Y